MWVAEVVADFVAENVDWVRKVVAELGPVPHAVPFVLFAGLISQDHALAEFYQVRVRHAKPHEIGTAEVAPTKLPIGCMGLAALNPTLPKFWRCFDPGPNHSIREDPPWVIHWLDLEKVVSWA